jgi:hypothetical protein
MAHYCEHHLPLTYEEYMSLPDVDGIVTDDHAFECGRPASAKWRGKWYCEEHMDAIERGMRMLDRPMRRFGGSET